MATNGEPQPEMHPAPCTCTIKTLDANLLLPAAETAIGINPANAFTGRFALASHNVVLPPEHLAVVTSRYWGVDGVRLTVGFLDTPPADLRQRIISHMNAWSQYANVSFVESSSNPQVRISRTPGDGYWSYVGTDILHIGSDKPTMNLDSFSMNTAESEYHRVVRHETGHTLGCPHEHTRSQIVNRIDHDKAIAYFKQTQNWDSNQVTAQVLTPLDNSALMATATADQNSIMCYWLPAQIMKDGVAVVGGTDIDAQDAAFIATVYPKPPYVAVYQEGDPGHGIGNYDLKSTADRAFAFDYDGSGKLDHIVLYRPGTGTIWILKNSGGNFSAVYHEGDPGHGIGSYDLKSTADRAFAFDYDGSGKLDHLVLYRPGTGTIWILKNSGGNFSAVYHEGDPGHGIGSYDLKSTADRAFAFDYDGSGKLDHLVLYRPGTGTIWILKNSGGKFAPVYQSSNPGHGIGGYDLKGSADQAFAFDYDGSGKLDHLVLYRPGTGTVWILRNSGGNFAPVYQSSNPGHGIGGYDLKSSADRSFALDYDGSGKLDHLAFYRPGAGVFWILKNSNGVFSTVYQQGRPGKGIGFYDMMNAKDAAFAVDYTHSGRQNYIALYRPGTGTFWIVKRRDS